MPISIKFSSNTKNIDKSEEEEPSDQKSETNTTPSLENLFQEPWHLPEQGFSEVHKSN